MRRKKNMAEYWDIYNEDREFTGRTIKRGEPFAEGEFYVCCEVWTMNSKGQMLITQRHPDKKAGGQWEFTGGGVLAGETTLMAAVREVKEELGVELCESELKLVDVYKARNYFMDIYVVRKDLEEDAITLDTNETVDWTWATKEEIEELIETGKMVRSVGMRYRMFGEKL
jgi:mutator protein MutT